MLVIPVLERLKQEDCLELGANLGYITILCLNTPPQIKNNLKIMENIEKQIGKLHSLSRHGKEVTTNNFSIFHSLFLRGRVGARGGWRRVKI